MFAWAEGVFWDYVETRDDRVLGKAVTAKRHGSSWWNASTGDVDDDDDDDSMTFVGRTGPGLRGDEQRGADVDGQRSVQ